MRGLYRLGCRLVKGKETMASHRGTVEGKRANGANLCRVLGGSLRRWEKKARVGHPGCV